MLNIENQISSLVEDHFPSFYNEEGPLFILFTKEYFEWLEKNYVYLTLNDPTLFEVGDTVTQNVDVTDEIAVGEIEAKNNNKIFVRVVEGTFRCNTKCLNNVTQISSSRGGSTFISEITSTNFLYYSRNLPGIRDLDRTNSRFYVYFKEKYLKNIQFDAKSSEKLLIKAAHELYSSKGTERSIDLLFKLVFGEPAKVFYPGEYVIQLSAGTWNKPTYIELSRSPRSLSFLNKTIFGVLSGAEAFCNSIITRNVKGKLVDVMYIDNVKGNFITGEPIVDEDKSVQGAPEVVGSLTKIDITSGGEGFEIGEEVLLSSSRGIGAKAIVSATEAETGIVRFTLVDGGWGYSNTSNSIKISQKVFQVQDVTNVNPEISGFQNFEVLTQELIEMDIANMVGNSTITTASDVVGKYVTNSNNAIGLVSRILNPIDANSRGNFLINKITGDITSNGFIRFTNNIFVTVESNNASLGKFSSLETIRQSNGTSNVSAGSISRLLSTTTLSVNTSSIVGNGIRPGLFAVQSGTGAKGYVVGIPANSYNAYSNVNFVVMSDVVGVFSNTNNITLYKDNELEVTETTFDPTRARITRTLQVNDASGQRWYPGNIVYGSVSGEVVPILTTSEVGGVQSTFDDVTVTANIIASNTTHIGVSDVINNFVNTPGNKIKGTVSNTTASILTMYTGIGANASVFQLVDTESIRINTDLFRNFNFGPTAFDVRFHDIDLTGANSTFGYMVDVLVENQGTGYSNTDKVIFVSGFSGNYSYGAANATIVTDDNGSIDRVILAANTGNGYSTNPTVLISNSSGGNSAGSNAEIIPLFPYGFPKYPLATLVTKFVDLLTFQNKTIGSIASLNNLNPGENYNIKPFVVPFEQYVAEFGKNDYRITFDNLNRSFVTGEPVVQAAGETGVELSCNLVSGSSSIATRDFIYSTDGINTIATGVRYSYVNNNPTNNYTIVVSNVNGSFQNTITTTLLGVSRTGDFVIGDTISQGLSNSANGILLSKNNSHLVIKSVQGTFVAGVSTITGEAGGAAASLSVNSSYQAFLVFTESGNNVFKVNDVDPVITSTFAKGRIISTNTSGMTVRRLSFFDDFKITEQNDLVGILSTANARILTLADYEPDKPAGLNANITANVVTTNGTITELLLTDSGFGYENDEGVAISSTTHLRSASGKATVNGYGIAQGSYYSKSGFLSDDYKLFDGDYYQDYSYEIRSPLPMDKYQNMILEVLHVAGTKMFGRLETETVSDLDMSVANSSLTIISQ
jgi:hypothetical protein